MFASSRAAFATVIFFVVMPGCAGTHEPSQQSFPAVSSSRAERATEPSSTEATHEQQSTAARGVPATGLSITLACGRATSRLPDGWTIDVDESQPCHDRNGTQAYFGEHVGGGRSDTTVVHGDCRLELVAVDREPTDYPLEDYPGVIAAPASFVVSTPESTTFEVLARLPFGRSDAACAAMREPLLLVVDAGLTIAPLRDVATRTRAQISSDGHGIELDLPAGYWLFSRGGESDVYETSYALRGPGATYAALQTWWRDASRPARLVGRVLPARPRFRRGVDPRSNRDDCRFTDAAGPDPRLVTRIVLCGPEEGDAALLQLLSTATFVR